MNIKKIEETREELYQLIDNNTYLYNEDVVEISQRLDKLIVENYEIILIPD